MWRRQASLEITSYWSPGAMTRKGEAFLLRDPVIALLGGEASRGNVSTAPFSPTPLCASNFAR